MSVVFPKRVKTFAKNGSTGLSGDVTISEGTNITLTQTGQDIAIAATGTGVATTEPFVTIGNTAGLSAERALTGTANQVTVTDNGANSTVVLSTPQDIHTAATPQFGRLGLGAAADASIPLEITSTTAGSVIDDISLVNVGGSTNGSGTAIVFNSFDSGATPTARVSNVRGTDNNYSLRFGNFSGAGITEQMRVIGTGLVGIMTTAPDRALEINHATGLNLRLTYNDSDGSAVNYADLTTSSSGDLTIDPSGDDVFFAGRASPSTNDGFALGVASTAEWSDLFLASGGVINFANSNLTLTHSSGVLTMTGQLAHAVGALTTPSLTFAGDTNTGFWQVVAGTCSFSSDGLLRWTAAANSAFGPAQTLRCDDSFGIGWSTDPNSVADEFILYRSAADTLRLESVGTVFFDGNFGVGASPSNVFHFQAGDNATVGIVKINTAQANITAADVFIDFQSSTGSEGSIAGTAVLGVLAYNTFTGSHWSQCDAIQKTQIETVSRKTVTRRVDKEDGSGEREDREFIVETPVKVYTSTLEPGTVLVSTDEMASWPDEVTNHLPKCAISSKKEDKAVYGVFGGHDRDGDILVLSLGSGIVLVTNEGGPISIGDFLCTSNTPGYAMRYDGNDMRVVLGKARQSLNDKQGKIACSYYAG
ncbi:MAG: hypothetical protein QME66_04160 [Candidatus Eisenbacteria bacterium]|nr:hypothetical protein [Candidatus Eisenbacteria bacterium]